MIAILIIVIPLIYPLMTHYEHVTELILHTLNKLSRVFVENEVKCCSQLYDYISNKSASDSAAKVLEKRRAAEAEAAQNEEDGDYEEAL
jgi:hypothetical protein